MALEVDATKQELIQELQARGFVTEGEFAQNSPLMEAIAAAMVTVIKRDAEVIINTGSSNGTYKVT
ncbi:hypothetical protein [Vibrio cyclitrophicus]|uniref:hypothetical protein n=1 Tax=Vibrio cyclitrophicus TaxID=47951 RepID=UPI000C83FFED|nr:hypothetical protein [Vibrio cyclitrophicus]PMF18924.1 hypothetical protein BCV24_10730 [Vibrio cyclitrophicus]